MVGVYVLTHLLLPMRGGPIRGAGGLCYVFACDDQRAYLATMTNLEAASGDVNVINCPICKANAAKLGIKLADGWKPDPELLGV